MSDQSTPAPAPRRRKTTRVVASRYLQGVVKPSPTSEENMPKKTNSIQAPLEPLPTMDATGTGLSPRRAKLKAKNALTRTHRNSHLPTREPLGAGQRKGQATVKGSEKRVRLNQSSSPSLGNSQENPRTTRRTPTPAHCGRSPPELKVSVGGPDAHPTVLPRAPIRRRSQQPNSVKPGKRTLATVESVSHKRVLTSHSKPSQPSPLVAPALESDTWISAQDQVTTVTTRLLQWIYVNKEAARQNATQRHSAQSQLLQACRSLENLQKDISGWTEKVRSLQLGLENTTCKAVVHTPLLHDIVLRLSDIQTQYNNLYDSLRVSTDILTTNDIDIQTHESLLQEIRHSVQSLEVLFTSSAPSIQQTELLSDIISELSHTLSDELEELCECIKSCSAIRSYELMANSQNLSNPNVHPSC
ncbi:hypothetical protein IWQ62_006186 [Dispira parvispora]|uniref:Uncharacterized protein n=1 Tax=Dispira parvispora TaxID=1520584 RepID=A0A9W8ANI0_9FUNG|nr:hypothetical protein IWQ62_006186 [Dispira parvispora]